MGFSSKFRVSIYAVMSASLIAGGCNALQISESGKPAAENLGAPSENKFSIFKKKKEPYDPVKAHLEARRMVDPSDLSTIHAYTKKELPREFLGPDVKIVMKDKPPPEERILEEEEPWYSGLIPSSGDDEESAEELEVASLQKAAPALPREQPAEQQRQQAKAVRSKVSQAQMAVKKLRIGEHPKKTRLVLDLTAEALFDYELRNDGNLLVVNLPDAIWEAQAKKVFAKHPLILAYIAKKAPDGGTVLAIKLRKPTKVLFNSVYKPTKRAGHRIVFDIAAS